MDHYLNFKCLIINSAAILWKLSYHFDDRETCYDTGNHTGAIEYYDKAKAIKWTLRAPKNHHHCVIHVTSIIRLNIIIRLVLKSAKDEIISGFLKAAIAISPYSRLRMYLYIINIFTERAIL